MKIEEAVQYMSKLYLERVIKSLNIDYPPKKGEDEYRDIINKNTELLADHENINQRFRKYIEHNSNNPYGRYLLFGFIIRAILSEPDGQTDEEQVITAVNDREKEIIDLGKKKDSFRHIDDRAHEIFSLILDAALEDDRISPDELSLIQKLRKKLSISEKDQFLIQANLGLFPTRDTEGHSRQEIAKALDDLQKCGIIFYCNKMEGNSAPVIIIPEEISSGIKAAIGIELIEDKYRLLLGNLQNKHLKDILKERNLLSSGVKDELIERVIHAGIQPSEALDYLTTNDLSDVCAGIPSLKVSGKKQNKIDRLIQYFSRLVIKEFEEDNTGQMYYEYLEELAMRDIDNLIGNKIVKDHDFIDRAFEDGTSFLFREKLNVQLIGFEGNEHADGGVVFQTGDSILLWDNKSKKGGEPYTFPESHLKQFLRYIHTESKKGRRVNIFMVVTASVDATANKNASILKSKSGVGTDIPVVTAENLKLVAENWQKYSDRDSFNLNVFNYTGVLDWETLRDRMSWHD